jgi:hypothetical protein
MRMRWKRVSAIGLLLCLCTTGAVVAQSARRAIDFDYEGTWGSNPAVRDSTYNSTFLRVERLGPNRYFVISVSTAPGPFTFVAGGFINENGWLQVTLEEGGTWLYTPNHRSGADPNVIIMSNLALEESFDSFMRIDQKFTEWPFPTAPEK